MKIPNKITKRQYTSLNKKNAKELSDIIECATKDHKTLASNLALNVQCIPDLDDKLTEGNYKETTNYWRIELNIALRSFIRTRNNIYKAYQKGIKK